MLHNINHTLVEIIKGKFKLIGGVQQANIPIKLLFMLHLRWLVLVKFYQNSSSSQNKIYFVHFFENSRIAYNWIFFLTTAQIHQ